jgi:leucyl-tRNA synthetase
MNNEEIEYKPSVIEPKWQKVWQEKDIYKTKDDIQEDNKYVLDMFPYPSGAGLHVGHPEGYTATDIYTRYLRFKGLNVLHPMGWDAFGLPAENYAIKTGVHPKVSTNKNIDTFRGQIQRLGLSYDWSREINTSDPSYYKWTQWLFLKLYEHGLAYRKEAPVNWCPGCQTVLANEQVVNGKCERSGDVVILENLNQWFFKITDYAQELLDDIDNLDWPEPIKIMQRNWIGKSTGAQIDFQLDFGDPEINSRVDNEGKKAHISVFTTRPDTIFGATYLVLAPEHTWIELALKHKTVLKNNEEVAEYIQIAKKKGELERQIDQKDKTGVELKGVKAINPATGEKISIWVADYVLTNYGTGAIMAVPAHDERDFEFAKKFDLPISQVIQPTFIDNDNPPQEEAEDTSRNIVLCIVKNPANDKYLTLRWRTQPWHVFITGGIEENEDALRAAQREITEETGYTDLIFKRQMPISINSIFYATHKKVNRNITVNVLEFELGSEKTTELKREEIEEFDIGWVEKTQLKNLRPVSGLALIIQWLEEGNFIHPGEGRLINSGQFDGMETSRAREEIVAWLEQKKIGKLKTQYKMRDWLISRQRYWGAPIPIIHCNNCGLVAVPEEDLPVILPEDVDFKPTGYSPLVDSRTFNNVVCPKCNEPARRESDTLDTFVDSSWYYLRYCDPHNQNSFADIEKINLFCPVDLYVGGAEHAVLHLLYSRFITKFLADIKVVNFREPFKSLKNQGLILAEDGRKMSKSLGNVVNPDDIVSQYGADCLRIYEMFMGPFSDAKPWSTSSIIGSFRFLQKIYKVGKETNFSEKEDYKIIHSLEKVKDKVTKDIEGFNFNTAISTLMEFIKYINPSQLSKKQWCDFLILLSPFAPHLAQELWYRFNADQLIDQTTWVNIDSALLIEDSYDLPVSINGKFKTVVVINKADGDNIIKEKVLANEDISKSLGQREISKIIIVPLKIVNIICKM